MAGIFPQSGTTCLAGVRGILLEAIQLRVGDRFADHGNEPDSGARFFENAERGANVEARDQKRRRQNHVEQRLELKKEKKAQGQVALPLFAQLNVAAFFRMADDSRK